MDKCSEDEHQNQIPDKAQERKKRKQCVEFILEECRMVIPGIQALFGFQLIAAFNQRFVELSDPAKMVHLTACFCAVVAIGFMMAPAAYHRQVEPDGIPESLCRVGSIFARAGMFALMISISLDIFVVSDLVTTSTTYSVFAGTLSLIFFAVLWFIFPAVAASQEKKPEEKLEGIINQLG
jgi:hypothetical protein